MNDVIDNKESLLVTTISNDCINLFDDLEKLGVYAYVKMLIDHQTSTLAEIIDKIKEKFNFNEDYIFSCLREFEEVGVVMIVKNKE